MTKINLKKVTIKKGDLAGYSASLQDVMTQTMTWRLSLKFSRIIRGMQSILSEFDDDRNTILESVQIEESDTEAQRRAKAKSVQERIEFLHDEDVEVFEVLASDLLAIYEKVSPRILIGFAGALIDDCEESAEIQSEEN